MTLNDIIGIVVIGAISIGCLMMLWVIVRFAVIGPLRTRGAALRLRHPRPEEVEAKWRVKLPAALPALFREHPIIERAEFYLAPAGSDRDAWLYIYGFIPLTALDVSEARKSSGVPGIPIAHGEEGGTYYLPMSALRDDGSVPVFLRRGRKDTEVAASIEQFFAYTPTEWPDDEKVA
jgi:hypothetical protein